MGVKQKLLAYFRLMRIQSGASESLLLLLGALTMGQRNLVLLTVIFFIGLLYHIDGFISNEYADIEVDRLSPELQNKPLVSGIVSKKYALSVAWAACIGAYLLTILFFFSPLPLLLLSLAVLIGTVYNFFRKKISGVSDFIVAGSLACMFLFGASTVTVHLSLLSFILSLLVFFGLVFANAIESGLKDVDHDYRGGMKTLATITGVTVNEGRLRITKTFAAFACTCIAVCFVLLLFLGFQPEVHFWSAGYLSLGITAVLSIVVLLASYTLLHLRVFDRIKIKRLYAVIN